MSISVEGWAPRYLDWSVEDLQRKASSLSEAHKSAWEEFQRATTLEERDRLSRQMRELKRQSAAVASALHAKTAGAYRMPRVPTPTLGVVPRTPEEGARTEAQTRTPELLERFREMREEVREREPEAPMVVAPPSLKRKPSASSLLALLALILLTGKT